ncbi:MAG: MFS transporter [Gammaproteobacteria bacterium]|nr:MFS transporter [Gammaproteobacteria bacterium]
MKIFLVLAVGQLVSLIGSHMTGFALGLRIYEQEESVTLFALVSFATLMPEIALGALAGTLVDRWNRRTALIIGNLGAGCGTLIIIFLNIYHELEVVHIIILVAISSSFNALIFPAFMAATSSLVNKEQLGRANGLVQLGAAISQIAAPALAGALLVVWQLNGVLLADVMTFSFALIVLLLIKIPDHKKIISPEDKEKNQIDRDCVINESHAKGLWLDLKEGWFYLKERKGLLWLLGFFSIANFNLGMVIVLFTPLVLSFTDTAQLGIIMSISGSGMLVGALVISVWGGAKNKINMVLGFLALQGLLFLATAFQPSFLLYATGAFMVMFTMPIIITSNQVIWQRKVAPEIQGRVFGLRTTIGNAFLPLAFLLAGTLADRVFEPLMQANTVLSQTIGHIIGTGDGRGIVLQMMILGMMTLLLVLLGYFQPQLRFLEDNLPDHS